MVYLDIVVSDQCCYAKNIVDKIDLKKLKTVKQIMTVMLWIIVKVVLDQLSPTFSKRIR